MSKPLGSYPLLPRLSEVLRARSKGPQFQLHRAEHFQIEEHFTSNIPTLQSSRGLGLEIAWAFSSVGHSRDSQRGFFGLEVLSIDSRGLSAVCSGFGKDSQAFSAIFSGAGHSSRDYQENFRDCQIFVWDSQGILREVGHFKDVREVFGDSWGLGSKDSQKMLWGCSEVGHSGFHLGWALQGFSRDSLHSVWGWALQGCCGDFGVLRGWVRGHLDSQGLGLWGRALQGFWLSLKSSNPTQRMGKNIQYVPYTSFALPL